MEEHFFSSNKSNDTTAKRFSPEPVYNLLQQPHLSPKHRRSTTTAYRSKYLTLNPPFNNICPQFSSTVHFNHQGGRTKSRRLKKKNQIPMFKKKKGNSSSGRKARDSRSVKNRTMKSSSKLDLSNYLVSDGSNARSPLIKEKKRAVASILKNHKKSASQYFKNIDSRGNRLSLEGQTGTVLKAFDISNGVYLKKNQHTRGSVKKQSSKRGGKNSSGYMKQKKKLQFPKNLDIVKRVEKEIEIDYQNYTHRQASTDKEKKIAGLGILSQAILAKKRRTNSITERNSKDKAASSILMQIRARNNQQSEEPPEILSLKNTIRDQKKKVYR